MYDKIVKLVFTIILITQPMLIAKEKSNLGGQRLLTKETGIRSPKLLHCAKRAELMKIKDLGRDYSDLLEAVGVESVSELKRRNAESLHESMTAMNNKQQIVDRMPSIKRVSKWIEESKDIKIKVSS